MSIENDSTAIAGRYLPFYLFYSFFLIHFFALCVLTRISQPLYFFDVVVGSANQHEDFFRSFSVSLCVCVALLRTRM